MGVPVTIRQVRRDGAVRRLGVYDPAARRLRLEAPGYPLLGPGDHRVEEDLPWALQDMAPAGYLARRFARWFPELGLPDDVRVWTAADTLRALGERGHDLAGNLLVGDESLAQFERALGPEHLPGPARGEHRAHHDALAGDVLGADGGQSSVGGERPKFTLRLADGAGLLVKFSPPLCTELGARWGDLLRVEAHCAATLRAAGLAAVEATFVEHGGRGYLEVDRFDRLPGGGRAGVVTLLWLGAARYGEPRDALVVAARLAGEGWLTEDERAALERVHAFSAAIGNTDAHLGNYALRVGDEGETGLAPFYDVLPMALAPRHDELPDPARLPRPPAPRADVRPLVDDLLARVAADPDVGAEFRAVWLAHLGRAG